MRKTIFFIPCIVLLTLCAKAQKLSFVKDVAPIIHSKCTPCHQPNEAAPFSLITYEDVAKRTSFIRQVVDSGYMPPWKPDPHYVEYDNDRSLTQKEKDVFHAVKKLGNKDHARLNWFQDSIAEGKPYEWRCRSGSRYLYICEDGKVHWCSQQRGFPGIPLEDYTMEDFKREYMTEKWCAPTCTIQCVHQVGILDNWRDPQMSEAEVRREQQQKKEERMVQILRPQ